MAPEDYLCMPTGSIAMLIIAKQWQYLDLDMHSAIHVHVHSLFVYRVVHIHTSKPVCMLCANTHLSFDTYPNIHSEALVCSKHSILAFAERCRWLPAPLKFKVLFNAAAA